MEYSYSENSSIYYSNEAEQAVLGSLLLKPSCYTAVSAILNAEHFFIPQHRSIYSAIVNLDTLNGGKFDPLLVLNALKGDGLFSEAEGKTYIYQLAESVPTTANVEAYARIIKEKYYVRTLVDAAKDIIESASDTDLSADDMLNSAEQKIYNIRKGTADSDPSHIKDILVNVYGRLRELTGDDREKYKGLSTGFEDLDECISGLNKSELIIIGARPAMGKTSFALNLARNVAVKSGKKVLMFSLEMSKEQLVTRVLSTEARVQSTKLRDGKILPKEWDQLLQAATFLSACPLYFDDTSSITVPEMKSKIRRQRDVECVVIDYLQLMQSANKRIENRTQEISEITRSLKLMAKDMHIPVVTCAQLSRGTEQRGKSHKPQLSDLRESGTIEQDADIVAMLYRENYYDQDSDVPQDEISLTAQLLIQKNRNGPTSTINLNWNPEFTLFTTQEFMLDDEN